MFNDDNTDIQTSVFVISPNANHFVSLFTTWPQIPYKPCIQVFFTHMFSLKYWAPSFVVLQFCHVSAVVSCVCTKLVHPRLCAAADKRSNWDFLWESQHLCPCRILLPLPVRHQLPRPPACLCQHQPKLISVEAQFCRLPGTILVLYSSICNCKCVLNKWLIEWRIILWCRFKDLVWPTEQTSPMPVTVQASSPQRFGWDCWLHCSWC